MAGVNQPPITGDAELDRFTKETADVLNSVVDASSGSAETDDQGRTIIDGQSIGYSERYLATRYGTDSRGANFTDDYSTIVGLTVWQGLRNSDSLTESSNPADYSWRELNVVAGWFPSYRIIGGRDIDWNFSTSTPTNFIVDNIAGAIDLDDFSSGATGPTGASIWPIYADDTLGTNQSLIQGSREFVHFFTAVAQPLLPITGIVFVKAVAVDGYSFRTDIAYFSSLSGTDPVYPTGLVTDGTYAQAQRGDRLYRGSRSLTWQTNSEVEPPVSTTATDYDIADVSGPPGSEGLSTRTDVAYATVLDDPISEIQRVVIEDATAISGQVNRVREVQTITPTDGRSNLREPGESPEIVTVGLPESADFGVDQEAVTVTLTGFNTSELSSSDNFGLGTQDRTVVIDNDDYDLTYIGSGNTGYIRLDPPTGFTFIGGGSVTINFDIISLGSNDSITLSMLGLGTSSGEQITVAEPGSYSLTRTRSAGTTSLNGTIYLISSGEPFSYRVTSAVYSFNAAPTASYEFILDTMGDVYQLQGVPSNSDADFWGYFNSVNRTAGADGAYPTSSTYWVEQSDGDVGINWQGTSIKSTATGPTTSPYRVGNEFYHKGAEFYTSGSNTYFTIRRESVLSATGEFDPNRTAQENTSDLTANIVNTYPGTSRSSIYTLPPLVGRVEVDFTNIDFDGFDNGGIFSDRALDTSANLVSYSVNGSGSGTTAENAAQSFRDSIINGFEEGIVVSVSGNVVTISSDVSFLFGFVARGFASSTRDVYTPFDIDDWTVCPTIRFYTDNVLIQEITPIPGDQTFGTPDPAGTPPLELRRRIGRDTIFASDITLGNNANVEQVFVTTLNSATFPISVYLQAIQHGDAGTFEPHSIYTVRDYNDSQIVTFTSSVETEDADDSDFVESQVVAFVNSNTETPLDFTGQIDSDGNIVLTGTDFGTANGTFSVEANHGDGSGTLSFSTSITVVGENREDSQAPTLRFVPPTGTPTDLTLFEDSTISQTMSQFEIAEYIRDNLNVDNWVVAGAGDIITFESAIGGDVLGEWDVIVESIGTSGTTTEQLNNDDFTVSIIRHGQATLSNVQYSSGRFTDGDYFAAQQQLENNYRADRIVSWIGADTEPVVSTDTADYNFRKFISDPDAVITSRIDSTHGFVFRNSVGMTTLTATVAVDNEDQNDLYHSTLEYRWLHGDNIVCVDLNRNVLDVNGQPVTATGDEDTGYVCSIGVPADSIISPNLGSGLRSINVGAEDVASSPTQFYCDIFE